jgi:glycosyltransferase involved in cell wall biosynthesis
VLGIYGVPRIHAWLVPPDDELILGRVLAAAVSDPAERAIRAANGRTLVEGSFTWSRIAARTAAVYEEAQAPAPGPST